MASSINESAQWPDKIYQIDKNTPVLGGPGGPDNRQAQQLANRTQYLKEIVDGISTGETPYTSVEAAQAKIDAGHIPVEALFSVRVNDSSVWVAEYQNVNGKAEPTGKALPSSAALEQVVNCFFQSTGSDAAFDFTDADGFSLYRIFTDLSFGTALAMLSGDGVWLRDLSINQSGDDGGLIFRDSDGFYSVIMSKDGVIAPQALRGDGKYSTSYTDAVWLRLQDADGFYKNIIDNQGGVIGVDSATNSYDYLSQDVQNKAYSQTVAGRYNANIKRLVSGLSHILVYGQSLSVGHEGWPALTTAAIENYDNLMMGGSIRPVSTSAPEFKPLETSDLKPLIAVVQSTTGSAVLTSEEIAVLTPGSMNQGEGWASMANALRRLWLQNNNIERDGERRFLISSTGVGGRTIEQLSKGANPELYQRPLQAVQLAKSIANTANDTYSLGAIIWVQGEYNYKPTHGGTTNKNEYKQLLDALYKDMVKDMADDIAEQSEAPALFLYQTGAAYSSDVDDLSIGMAQWEYSKENTDAYMVTPVYPFPDKEGHLGPNGYRWMDQQFAKVLHRVLNLGEGWEPLSPLKIDVMGTDIYISFHVPVPPLQFRPVYVKCESVIYNDKGFRVTDDGGVVGILSVSIEADTIIKIALSRALNTGAKLWYGDATVHTGNGNLFDSDGFSSLYNYEYDAGNGQYDEENIPELIGKPYPLNNACIQFCISI